jgi:hypothetical protein
VILRTTIDIDAPAALVWSVLTDFAAYPEWNPLTVRVEGVARVDEVVALHVELGGKTLRRKHVISRLEPEKALCWTIRTRKPWLMRGERCQTIEDLGDGRCRYANCEGVHGLASVVVAIAYKRTIHAALEACSKAVKQRAEALFPPK